MNEQVFALARSLGEHADVAREIENVIRVHLRTWPDSPAEDEAAIAESARLMAEVVMAPAYRSLLRQVPSAMIRRFTGPLLAIYGGKDLQVPGQSNKDAFQRETGSRRNSSVRLFAEHNHFFQLAKTGSISEYESLPPGPDLVVLREIAEWLSGSHWHPI